MHVEGYFKKDWPTKPKLVGYLRNTELFMPNKLEIRYKII